MLLLAIEIRFQLPHMQHLAIGGRETEAAVLKITDRLPTEAITYVRSGSSIEKQDEKT